MSARKVRHLESPSGTGKVYRQDQPIADVLYRLQVKQEFVITKGYSGTSELPGVKDGTGRITVIKGERNLMDGDILHLRDGRQWRFQILGLSSGSGKYEVGIIDEL